MNVEKIKEVTLCFENCEICILKPDMFRYLVIEGITIKKKVNCFQYKNGEILENKSCNYFSIQINEKGLKQLCWDETLKERLNRNDIVAVIITYQDGNEEEIYVPWGNEDYINEYQKNTYTEDRNMQVIIEKGE